MGWRQQGFRALFASCFLHNNDKPKLWSNADAIKAPFSVQQQTMLTYYGSDSSYHTHAKKIVPDQQPSTLHCKQKLFADVALPACVCRCIYRSNNSSLTVRGRRRKSLLMNNSKDSRFTWAAPKRFRCCTSPPKTCCLFLPES